jgi:hypothetical protein
VKIWLHAHQGEGGRKGQHDGGLSSASTDRGAVGDFFQRSAKKWRQRPPGHEGQAKAELFADLHLLFPFTARSPAMSSSTWTMAFRFFCRLFIPVPPATPVLMHLMKRMISYPATAA